MYNAENRPIRWTQGSKVITMAFDRLGRRVSYREMNGATQLAHTVFLYNGYLCIQQLFSNEPWNVYKEFIWDPTEPVATRPLAFRQYGKTATFLMHDGNKNVTDVITVAPNNTPVAHYDYAPFGAATATGTRASDNPFRFSSEFADDTLALVYYNYRHYNPADGRWMRRDPIEMKNLYLFVENTPCLATDILGKIKIIIKQPPVVLSRDSLLFMRYKGAQIAMFRTYPIAFTRALILTSVECVCDSDLGWIGSIDAILFLTIYIYDEEEKVTINSNKGDGLGTRDDVLRHEEEHIKDYEEKFNLFFSDGNVPYFYFDSKEECQKKMRQKLKECHRQYNEWSRNYLNEGHQAPKYRKNGNAFAEGNFVR